MTARLLTIPRPLLVVTIGRLAFVPIIILTFDRQPAVTALALALLIATDLYDGVLARSLDADDTARRTLDVLVDRIAIWAVYLVVVAQGFLPLVLLAVFGLRELYAAYWCQRLLRERDVVLRSDWLCRGLNLMLAGWVVVAQFAGAPAREFLFGAVLLVSAVAAHDVVQSLRFVLTQPADVRSMVLPAGVLRRARSPRATRVPARTATASSA